MNLDTKAESKMLKLDSTESNISILDSTLASRFKIYHALANQLEWLFPLRAVEFQIWDLSDLVGCRLHILESHLKKMWNCEAFLNIFLGPFGKWKIDTIICSDDQGLGVWQSCIIEQNWGNYYVDYISGSPIYVGPDHLSI